MAPIMRERYELKELDKIEFKRSAVIIVLCKDENDALFIPLIERFTYNGLHSGQISLPGGKFEEGDETHRNTALRECYEEIGVESAHIELLGDLTELFISVSKFLVEPVVGICKIKNVAFVKNEREVKNIIKLFVNDLLNDSIVKSGTVEVGKDLKLKTPYFEVEGFKVWGATAMILSEFKTLLLR
jgi:8-oxo-dGTP pyrophosphatase MutT (NUDIX family)